MCQSPKEDRSDFMYRIIDFGMIEYVNPEAYCPDMSGPLCLFTAFVFGRGGESVELKYWLADRVRTSRWKILRIAAQIPEYFELKRELDEKNIKKIKAQQRKNDFESFFRGRDEISELKIEIESIEKEIPALQGKVKEKLGKWRRNM
jgi:hypothetical protein